MTGQLPLGICRSRSLKVLHLSNNNIVGVLPDCFRNKSNLTSLNRNRNHLRGLVPRSLVNCRLLEVLDLGNNLITDMFPRWLEALSELQVLVLRSNKLHGSVENSNSKLLFSKLRILDLSGNLFTGCLPTKYFENFKAMMDLDEKEREPTYIGGYEDSVVLVVKGLTLEYTRILNVLTTIDLSDNKFYGEIPINIKMVNSLHFLNLSHNYLIGKIPAMLDNLSELESLDLSSNQIQRHLPAQLTRLTFLVVFNVSHNQLSGTIPQGGQFNTFGNDSYQGNLGLCGFPLSNNCVDHKKPSQLPQEEDDNGSGFFDGFTWDSVALGYGCGIVIGVGLGCLMFSTEKPICFMKIVKTQKRRQNVRIYVLLGETR